MAAGNPSSLKTVKTISRPGTVFAVARQPNSGRLFLGCSDFKVYDGDVSPAKPDFKELGHHRSYVTGIVLAGKKLITGSYDGRLIWWEVEKRVQLLTVNAHKRWIRQLAGSPDSKTVASVADDMVARLWDAETGRLIHELHGHKERTPNHFPSMLFACAFSADGKYLATADKVGHVVIWEVASGKQATSLEAPGLYTWDPVQRRHSIGGIRSTAFSPDGKLLAVGGIGKIENIDHLDGKARVEVFDWQRGERTHLLESDKFKGLVERLQFHPRGSWLLAAGGAGDGFLEFIDLKEKKKYLRQEKVALHVHDLTMNESGDTIYAVGTGKIIVMEMKG